MIRFSFPIEIGRPVEDVFAYVTDPAKLPEWQTNTAEVEQITDGPVRVGTRLREVHMGFGRRLEQVVEVAEYQPPRCFALKVLSGSLPIDGRWDFEPDAGGTRLTLTVEGRVAGWLRVLQPLVAVATRRQMLAHHRRLKRTLEGSADATAPPRG